MNSIIQTGADIGSVGMDQLQRIGLADVYSFTDKSSRAGLPELKEVNVQSRDVPIYFDSDIHFKKSPGGSLLAAFSLISL